MLIEAYRAPDNSFHWLDVCDPTGAELEQIVEQYGLHAISVRDCLMPKHLPKVEIIEGNVFIILRAYSQRARNSGSVRGLTRKVAIFMGENYLITVHRREDPYIVQIRDNWVKNPNNWEGQDIFARLLIKIFYGVFSTYSEAIYHCEMSLEEFERKIFRAESTRRSIQQKFLVKRKTHVFRRMLRMSLDLLPKIEKYSHSALPWFQDMKELGESLYFSTEEILENVNNLINLHLSLASNQTSEVVRILTFFSVFFMPISFIASIYGMNFKNMPELDYRYAYPIVLCVMLSISGTLFWWFKRKKWM